jgi:hypothetical protein
MTEASGMDTSELPDLTPQQQKFVEGLAVGMTASEAYRNAYDCSGSQPNTIWVSASRLKANPNVALWIEALQAAGFTRIAVSRDDHLRELERLRNVAERSGNLGAAVQAEQLRGKVAGHYVEKVEHYGGQPDTADRLRALADSNPELATLAQAIAAKHGLDINKPAETRH